MEKGKDQLFLREMKRNNYEFLSRAVKHKIWSKSYPNAQKYRLDMEAG